MILWAWLINLRTSIFVLFITMEACFERRVSPIFFDVKFIHKRLFQILDANVKFLDPTIFTIALIYMHNYTLVFFWEGSGLVLFVGKTLFLV